MRDASSGLYQLEEYRVQRAYDRGFPAATSSRPVVS